MEASFATDEVRLLITPFAGFDDVVTVTNPGPAVASNVVVELKLDPLYRSLSEENASVRLSPQDARWEVALIGTNLANDTWYPVGTSKPYGLFTPTSGDLTSILQPPREVTLQVTHKF